MNTRSKLIGAALHAIGQRPPRSTTSAAPNDPKRPRTQLVIGHRGASGYRPEHTLEAYRLAARQGAVSIEPDLVLSRDGHLVARHENELSRSTDVARLPQFAHLRTTKVVSGKVTEGWFTEDFTLAEMRELSARERRPKLRAANTYYDGLAGGILTFDEVLAVAGGLGIAVHAELKLAHYFETVGLDLTGAVVDTLARSARNPEAQPTQISLMGFEPCLLRRLRREVAVPLVQLIDRHGRPDGASGVSTPRFRDLVTSAGLEQVAEYAEAVGVHKDWVLPRNSDDQLAGSSKVVKRAHLAGLEVLAWTVRAENKYLPVGARSSTKAAEYGDVATEVAALREAGVDGILTDHPDLVVRALVRR